MKTLYREQHTEFDDPNNGTAQAEPSAEETAATAPAPEGQE